MDSNTKITSHHICGFWFHVNWENEDLGVDQHGGKWINKSNPRLNNESIISTCLSNYVNILKTKK